MIIGMISISVLLNLNYFMSILIPRRIINCGARGVILKDMNFEEFITQPVVKNFSQYVMILDCMPFPSV